MKITKLITKITLVFWIPVAILGFIWINYQLLYMVYDCSLYILHGYASSDMTVIPALLVGLMFLSLEIMGIVVFYDQHGQTVIHRFNRKVEK